MQDDGGMLSEVWSCVVDCGSGNLSEVWLCFDGSWWWHFEGGFDYCRRGITSTVEVYICLIFGVLVLFMPTLGFRFLVGVLGLGLALVLVLLCR